MNENSVASVFQNVSTPSLTDEQRREIAKLLSAYLNSRDFAEHVQEVLDRYSR